MVQILLNRFVLLQAKRFQRQGAIVFASEELCLISFEFDFYT